MKQIRCGCPPSQSDARPALESAAARESSPAICGASHGGTRHFQMVRSVSYILSRGRRDESPPAWSLPCGHNTATTSLCSRPGLLARLGQRREFKLRPTWILIPAGGTGVVAADEVGRNRAARHDLGTVEFPLGSSAEIIRADQIGAGVLAGHALPLVEHLLQPWRGGDVGGVRIVAEHEASRDCTGEKEYLFRVHCIVFLLAGWPAVG